jgi:hypothetical protein
MLRANAAGDTAELKQTLTEMQLTLVFCDELCPYCGAVNRTRQGRTGGQSISARLSIEFPHECRR